MDGIFGKRVTYPNHLINRGNPSSDNRNLNWDNEMYRIFEKWVTYPNHLINRGNPSSDNKNLSWDK